MDLNYKKRWIKEAILYERLSTNGKTNGKVKCKVCQRRCEIAIGKKGFCRTRLNIDGTLFSLIYGIISLITVDPIEEKPFCQFRPGTYCLSVGTFGCNFRCKGCQNVDFSWSDSVLDKLDRLEKEDRNVCKYVSPEELIEIAKEKGCKGIAYTYNEPTIWLEYTLDSAKLAKKNGLYTVYVTNTYITPEHLDAIGPYMDALRLDIKSMEDKFYQDLCAVPSVNKVLEGIVYARRKWDMHIETNTMIIPGYNDDYNMLRKLARWIRTNLGPDSPWHVARFFPYHQLSHLSLTPLETLEKIKRIGEEEGLTCVNIEKDKGCDCAKDTQPLSNEIEREESCCNIDLPKRKSSCCD